MSQCFYVSVEFLFQKIVNVVLQPGAFGEAIPFLHQNFVLLLFLYPLEFELLELFIEFITIPVYFAIDERLLLFYFLLKLGYIFPQLFPWIILIHKVKIIIQSQKLPLQNQTSVEHLIFILKKAWQKLLQKFGLFSSPCLHLLLELFTHLQQFMQSSVFKYCFLNEAIIIMLVSKAFKYFNDYFKALTIFNRKTQPVSPYVYKPSPLLFHHNLQSIYELFSQDIIAQYQREKIFFADGGHVCLDWVNKFEDTPDKQNVPILFVMHGMTGGSECRYMKIMAKISIEKGYTCLCFNSRGFNTQMTSPVPFVGIDFHELQQTLQRVKTYYPKRPIHMVGMSLGGNYLLRYLIKYGKNSPLTQNIKSLSLVCPPFDVKYVIYNMNMRIQKYFIKYYLDTIVLRHQQMKFWWENKIIDYDLMNKSTNLKEFHQRITEKILGERVDDIFDKFKITNQEIKQFPFSTLLITAKDDPMVLIESVPVEEIKSNKNIKFCLTDQGAHMCWFQGWKPERWYPKPIFQFIEDISKGKSPEML